MDAPAREHDRRQRGVRAAVEQHVDVHRDQPPFAIDDKQQLEFTYCSDPMEILDGAWGALPFGVRITGLPNAPAVLPPRESPT